MRQLKMMAERQDDTSPAFTTIARGDAARLSGPGLRSFLAIADAWGLSERERLGALGEPPRSTYYQWVRKARAHGALSLPFDTLLRLSAIIGVYKALAILFQEQSQAMEWLKGPHAGTVFRGAPPLVFIVEGALDGIMAVRRYLDAWRGGDVGTGALEGSFEPVGEDDIVFA
jgi:hypothetical protein